MNFLSSIGQGLVTLADSAVGADTDVYQDSHKAWLAGVNGGGPGVRLSARTVKQLAIVFAAVNRKATTFGAFPCKIYRRKPDGSKEVATNHPLYDVLYRRPNDFQTAFDFRRQMQGWLELRGNACAIIKPGPRGAVDQLLPMHPDRLVIDRLRDSGKFRYTYSNPVTSKREVYMQDEVFHIRDLCDEDGIGQSRISAGASAMGLALTQQDYVTRFTKNDSRPAALLTGTNFRTKEEEQQFRDSWQEGQTGKNRGKIGLAPPGTDLKVFSVSAKDAQLLESMQRSDIELCVLMDMLPSLLGIDAGKSATFGSFEMMLLWFAQQTMLPIAVNWEQAIETQLITSPDYFPICSLTAMLRADDLTRAAFYHDAIADGWMCQDDVRALENMNPLPNGIGKRYWMQLNMAPIDDPSRDSDQTAGGDAVQPANGSKSAARKKQLGRGSTEGEDANAAFRELAEHDLGRSRA